MQVAVGRTVCNTEGRNKSVSGAGENKTNAVSLLRQRAFVRVTLNTIGDVIIILRLATTLQIKRW